MSMKIDVKVEDIEKALVDSIATGKIAEKIKERFELLSGEYVGDLETVVDKAAKSFVLGVILPKLAKDTAFQTKIEKRIRLQIEDNLDKLILTSLCKIIHEVLTIEIRDPVPWHSLFDNLFEGEKS